MSEPSLHLGQSNSRPDQCEAATTSNIHGGYRCSFKPKVFVDGSWLCGIHAKQSPILPWHLAVPARKEEIEHG